MLWPLEGMHWSLRWLAKVMPWAPCLEAARAVLQRGWGLTHLQGALGFLSCGAWSLLLLAALVLSQHRRALLLAHRWLTKGICIWGRRGCDGRADAPLRKVL